MTSRSIMRWIAAMKGEPVPTFDKEAGKDKITVEDLAKDIPSGTRTTPAGREHIAAAILEKYTVRRKP